MENHQPVQVTPEADGTFATFEWERFQNGSTCGFLLNGIKDEAIFIIENVPKKAWGEIKHFVTQQTLIINVQNEAILPNTHAAPNFYL